MKKSFWVLCFFGFLFFSCQQNKWTQKDKESYLAGCTGFAQEQLLGTMTDIDVNGVCGCALEKVMKKYPDADADAVEQEEINKINTECMKEAENAAREK